MSSPDRPDYSSLITQATTALERKGKADPLRASRRRRKLAPLVGSAIAAVVILYSGMQIWARLAPPSEKQVEQDLEKTIDRARAALDEARQQTGQLPEQLPAAMASVVRYERADKAYTLSATILGVRVTMTSDGIKRTDHGMKE